jgi:hypothetical protein
LRSKSECAEPDDPARAANVLAQSNLT